MGQTHTVEQGEFLSSIALDYGFSDFHTIYDHPQNADFKRNRPDPNVIYPGDQLYIPDKADKQESAATDQIHKFQIKSSKLLLKIRLKDVEDNPMGNEPFTLIVGNLRKKGTTDGGGLLQQEIPADAREGELRLDKAHLKWNLRIGYLDPVDSHGNDPAIITGIQARLNNLGFLCGPADGVLGARTKSALEAFQKKFGLGVSGTPNTTTRSKLADLHGC
jgi:N-acetylmuramoyl-L-alanine amidase